MGTEAQGRARSASRGLQGVTDYSYHEAEGCSEVAPWTLQAAILCIWQTVRMAQPLRFLTNRFFPVEGPNMVSA